MPRKKKYLDDPSNCKFFSKVAPETLSEFDKAYYDYEEALCRRDPAMTIEGDSKTGYFRVTDTPDIIEENKKINPDYVPYDTRLLNIGFLGKRLILERQIEEPELRVAAVNITIKRLTELMGGEVK